MSSHVYIGLDLGSSSLKIAAFEGVDGTVLALAGASIPWQRAATGVCQVSGKVLRHFLTDLLAKVCRQLGRRARDVAAIACVGHGGGLYIVDAHGELQNDFAVSSTDQRATRFANTLSQTRGCQLFASVGCAPWSGQPSMIAADIFRQNPAAAHRAATLFFAKDYLSMMLCGELATDYSDASTAGLLDSKTRRPSELAFAVADVPWWKSELLAPLRDSGSPLGQLRPAVAAAVGLPAATPVAMGAIDLYGAMTAAGAVQPGDVAAVFGTWCVNAAVGPNEGAFADAGNENVRGVSNVVLLDSNKSVMYMNNSAASMANTTWFAGTVNQSPAALLDAAFSCEPGANGLSYIPFINGGGNANAAFLGLRAFHTQADMARAVVEGVIALHAKSLNELVASGLPRRRLFALGGGAGDSRLTTLLATMLGETVYTPGPDESGARGAAMFAAWSINEAAAPMQVPQIAIEPTSGQGRVYGNHLANFEAIMAEMEPVFLRTSTSPQ